MTAKEHKLRHITIAFTCCKCGENVSTRHKYEYYDKKYDIMVHPLDQLVSHHSSSCDICHEHGSVWFNSVKCPKCGKSTNISITDW